MVPLYKSVEKGDAVIAALLIEAGVDFNATTDGYTVVYLAVHRRHEAIVDMLLDAGADAQAGDLPAHEAALAGDAGNAQLRMMRKMASYAKKQPQWRAISMFALLDQLFRWFDFGVPATATMWASVVVVSVLFALVFVSMLKRCHLWADTSVISPPFATNGANRWGMRSLVIVGFLVAVLFFIPLSTSLLSVFDCSHADDGSWMLDASNGAETCFTASHVALMIFAALALPLLFYWAVLIQGTNGSYVGVKYYLFDKGRVLRGEESVYYARPFHRRVTDFSSDRAIIAPFEWHLFLLSPWLPRRVSVATLVLQVLLIAVSVYATDRPRVQLYASLALSLINVLLVVVHPHQYWRRSMSIVYVATRFVLATSWAVAAFVYEDQQQHAYTHWTPGGDDGPTFIVDGPLQFWHWLLLHMAAAVVGAVNVVAAMHWRPDPTAAADDALAADKQRVATEVAAVKARVAELMRTEETSTTAAAVDEVDAVDESAASLSSRASKRRSRRASRHLSSSSATASLAAHSASPPSPPSPRRAGQRSPRLSPRSADSGSPRRRRLYSSRQDK